MRNYLDIMSADEVSKMLGFSRDTILRMARKGELPRIRLNSRVVVFRRSSIETFLRKREEVAVR